MKTKLTHLVLVSLLLVLFNYLWGCKTGPDPIVPSKELCGATKVGNQNLNAIVFINPHKGIGVGNAGTIITTGNGGYNWTIMGSLTSQNLYGIGAATPMNLAAVGGNGTVLYTTDGGTTWTPSVVNTRQTLRTVAFYTASNGYAAGDSGVVLFTTDAGANWTKVHGDSTQNYYGLSYNSNDTLYIVGNNGVFLKGSAFSSISVTTRNLKSIHFALDSTVFTHRDIGFAVGDSGTVYKTTDGGITWTKDTSNTAGNLRSVFLTTSNWGYSVGENGTVIRYNGRKWTLLPQVTPRNLNGVDPDVWSDGAYCIGDDGTVMSLCPPPVPNELNTVSPFSDDCRPWSFDLNIDNLVDRDEEGSIINYVSFTVSSSVVLEDMAGGSGWAVNDNFHKETGIPETRTYREFNLSTSATPGPSYITCCLKDEYGNKWLLGKYVCPSP